MNCRFGLGPHAPECRPGRWGGSFCAYSRVLASRGRNYEVPPVFVDFDEAGNIGIRALQVAITSLIGAVCNVHCPELLVAMVCIIFKAQVHHPVVIADRSLALHAQLDGIRDGPCGQVASFSLYSTKHMTIDEGGMVA